MKVCPSCHENNALNVKFCCECGSRFTSAPPPPPPVSKSKEKCHIPPPPPPVQSNIPDAAVGAEAEQLYTECLERIRVTDPSGVNVFKGNCRAYGLNKLTVEAFYASLVLSLGKKETVSFVPILVRLIPHPDKRKILLDYNTSEEMELAALCSDMGSVDMGAGKSNPNAKTDFLNRYNDHPSCDVCNGTFEMKKRRHQCRKCGKYVCSSCSPAKLLISPGDEIKMAKGYDPSIPQRVCIECAPGLHAMQADLGKQYGLSNAENPHEAQGRFHVPYSSSLAKECRNAADILGNFFRKSNASSSDRSIPVSLLEKAHGLAIMTIIKAGFLITGKIGTGLVIGKLPDGTWSAPSAIGTAGLGGGLEIGGEIVEVMIILGSPGAVKVFHKSQLNIGAGLDLAVGPYGRSAEAVASASASGLNANYSYSQSKGLYAGISLQGAVIKTRKDLNTKFYSREIDAKDILSGQVERPKAAETMYEALDAAMRGVAEHRQSQADAIAARGGCNSCGCTIFVPHTKQIWNKSCKSCKHEH